MRSITIILINIKLLFENMIVVGLLSTEEEVEDIKYISKVAALEDRIHYVVRMDKIKKMLKKG